MDIEKLYSNWERIVWELCLLLYLVLSWVPWFSQVAAFAHLSWSLHTSSGVTINQALHSHKFLSSSSFSFHLHVHMKLKHVLGSFSSIFIRHFSLCLNMLQFIFSLADSIWFFFISYWFVRFISVLKHSIRFIYICAPFNRFNWQEMGLPCEFGVWCKFWWVLET